MKTDKMKKPGATYMGMVPDTDEIYRSGWNFLIGKNLNQPHGERSGTDQCPIVSFKEKRDGAATIIVGHIKPKS